MAKITSKIKNNNGSTPYRRHKPSGSGFVILFAVTLASILLAIALGVADIALKELKFGTSARDTNNALFAADTGIEHILFLDKPSPGPGPIFVPSPSTTETRLPYIVTGLGSAGVSCAVVTVTKSNTIGPPPSTTTTVISKGYNVTGTSCGDPAISNLVERELKVTY